MLTIPIQPVPSQQVFVVLGGQNCAINIYQKGCRVYVDLTSNGTAMCIAALAHNAVGLDACNAYDGFQGDLYFIDTQGLDDPQYTGMGSRWKLVYLTASEVEMIDIPNPFPPIAPTVVLSLAATLEVTASEGGNFEVAHGLSGVPYLIEIIPTSAGKIWAQPDFADGTNVYLTASDAGVTAKVLVYLITSSDLSFISPDKTLNISSPAPGDFTVAHGLGVIPSLVEILPASGGQIWQQAPPDATNLYFAASEVDVAATISLYLPASPINILGPAVILTAVSATPGNFNIPHGLNAAPSRIEILMISAGSIWAQLPSFDESEVYLTASDTGITALILVYT
jgi:hypothetical protein